MAAPGRPSAFIILCCSLSLTLVEGLYTLQAQLHGYDNPSQLRVTDCNIDGCSTACCDGTGTCTSGGRRCDTFFIFCLRPFESSDSSGCGSSSGSVMVSIALFNADEIFDFSQSTFLGLSNPLVFQGLTNIWNGTQVYIEIRDADNPGSQLIDIILINIPVPSLGTPTGIVKHQGLVEIAEIELNISVLCAQNFQGSDCAECISGFTGTLCNEIDDCVNVTCSGNGQCADGVGFYTCNCDPGFTGMECEDNIDECIDPGVNCSGNGQCVDELGSYSCNCSAGYNGTNCEINIDDCLSNPCGVNGQCIDGIDSFTCICKTGYTGTMCDSDIDECQSNPCGTNGQCENQEGTFSCSCDPDFTGEHCQFNIDDCVGVNCSGNGECFDGVNSFTCQCSPGHGGTLCAEELQSSGIRTGPIVGGVLGVLISLILILVIVVAVVLIMRCQNRQGKGTLQGRQTHSGALPGDNPVYDRGNTTGITLGGLTQTSAPVHYVNLSSTKRDNVAESAPERVFDNPIYGGNEDEETEDMYADPDTNHQAGTGMGSSPYHEFDNPIYGGETEESTYSMLAADSSTVNGTAAATGQTMYANTKRGAPVVDNEQVYDHVN